MPDLELEPPSEFSDSNAIQISVSYGQQVLVNLACIINVKNLNTDPNARVKIQQTIESLLKSIPLNALTEHVSGININGVNAAKDNSEIIKQQEALRSRLEKGK